MKKAGRPPFTPTDEQRRTVAVMSACGARQEVICKEILGASGRPVTLKTLLKYFRTELDHGQEEANRMVAGSLFQKCMGDGPASVTACIFWLKTRAGWKDTAPDMGKGQYVFVVPAKQSVEEWVKEHGEIIEGGK